MIKNDFDRELKKRPLEDIKQIKYLEGLLLDKRSFIFQMPSKKSSVIVLFSGGLDSVSQTFYLLKEYQLTVYPLFINRGQKRFECEEKSVKYYDKFFGSLFPKLYKPIFIFDAFIPPEKIRFPITANSENRFVNKATKQRFGLPFMVSMLAINAAYYAYYLEIEKQIRIRTIFINLVRRDGTAFSYETFTSLRNTMYHLCSLSCDYSWQITSVALERELGNFFHKDFFIKYCYQNGLSLTNSWSCFHKRRYHCGECMGCLGRKKAFAKSKINDETVYENNIIKYRIINKVRRMVV